MSGITRAQQDVLLSPLAKNRVETREGMSYLNVSDVRRWLIRIFGFGGFSYTVSEAELISHQEVPQTKNPSKMNQVVCWKVKVALDVPALGAHYEGYAIGSSSQPSLAEAHDMAIKTAESDALKRCAVNLGDQFGLSLYFSKGREVVTSSVLRVLDERIVIETDEATSALPPAEEDVQAAPEQGLSVRHEETDAEGEAIVVDTATGEVVEEPAAPPAKAKRKTKAQQKAEDEDGARLEAEEAVTDPDPQGDEDPVMEQAVKNANRAGIVALPEDFWDAMSLIRKEESQQKRLQAGTKYKLHLMNQGIRGDLEVLTPSGTKITIDRAFDVALAGM